MGRTIFKMAEYVILDVSENTEVLLLLSDCDEKTAVSNLGNNQGLSGSAQKSETWTERG